MVCKKAWYVPYTNSQSDLQRKFLREYPMTHFGIRVLSENSKSNIGLTKHSHLKRLEIEKFYNRDTQYSPGQGVSSYCFALSPYLVHQDHHPHLHPPESRPNHSSNHPPSLNLYSHCHFLQSAIKYQK